MKVLKASSLPTLPNYRVLDITPLQPYPFESSGSWPFGVTLTSVQPDLCKASLIFPPPVLMRTLYVHCFIGARIFSSSCLVLSRCGVGR